MKKAWTPGPWKACHSHVIAEIGGGICKFESKHGMYNNYQTNGHLIAASVDLYDAMERIIQTSANPASLEHAYAIYDGLAALRKADGV